MTMATIATHKTIAGNFYYRAGDDSVALYREPTTGRVSLVLNPFKAGGAFVTMDNARFAYAGSHKAMVELAAEFFAAE